MWSTIVLALLCQSVAGATVARSTGPVLGSSALNDFPQMRPIANKKTNIPTTDFVAMKASALQAASVSNGAFALAAGDPVTPPGYTLAFGPTNGATQADGFMGFVTMSTYDVGACAQACNARTADASGGACKFFNIWQSVVNGTPGQTTCALYFTPTDGGTATNTGSPPTLSVTQSRGYTRTSILPDGGFEELPPCARSHPFCSANGDATWTLVETSTSTDTTSQILRLSGAHTGTVFASLGFFDATNTGIWAPASPLITVPGATYVVTLYMRVLGGVTGSSLSTNFAVIWNGVVVLSPRPTDFDWNYFEVRVVAAGNDLLRFRDDLPDSQIPTSAIDDIFVFQA